MYRFSQSFLWMCVCVLSLFLWCLITRFFFCHRIDLIEYQPIRFSIFIYSFVYLKRFSSIFIDILMAVFYLSIQFIMSFFSVFIFIIIYFLFTRFYSTNKTKQSRSSSIAFAFALFKALTSKHNSLGKKEKKINFTIYVKQSDVIALVLTNLFICLSHINIDECIVCHIYVKSKEMKFNFDLFCDKNLTRFH